MPPSSSSSIDLPRSFIGGPLAPSSAVSAQYQVTAVCRLGAVSVSSPGHAGKQHRGADIGTEPGGGGGGQAQWVCRPDVVAGKGRGTVSKQGKAKGIC